MQKLDSIPFLSLGEECYIFKGSRLCTREAGTSAVLFPKTDSGGNFQVIHDGADLTVEQPSLYLVRFWATGYWKEGEALYMAVNGQPVCPLKNPNRPRLATEATSRKRLRMISSVRPYICMTDSWPDLWDFEQEAVLFLTPSDCLSIEATSPDSAPDNQLAVTLLALSLD